MFGISPMQLIIILVIVILLFGTKKLRSLGTDLGSAIKGFKKAVTDKDADFDEQEKSKVEDKTIQTNQQPAQPDSVKQKPETKAD